MKKATEGTVAGTNTNTSSLPREVSIEIALKELAVLLALKQVAAEKGLTLAQLSDFHTPWGAAPASKEEGFFQDLVWIHRALPPTEKFNQLLAAKGTYKKLRLKVLADFWSNYDPEHKSERRQHIPLKKYQSISKGLRPSRPTRRKNHAI